MEQYIKTLPDFMVLVRCYTFNHATYITDALNGFTMQRTNFPFVVVVIDDASIDGEHNVIKEYIKKYFKDSVFQKETDYANITLAHHVSNKNCYIATYLLKENHHSQKKTKVPYLQPWRDKCKYEALCEGDDYWVDPLKLQKQVDSLEKNPSCSIAFCSVQCVSVDKQNLLQTIPLNNNKIKEGIVTLSDYVKEEFSNGNWTFHTSSFLVRISLLSGYTRIIQNEFKAFPYGDMPLLLYFLLKGDGYFISDIGSCYRMLSGGYNSKIKANKDFKIKQEQKLIDALTDFNIYTNYKYNKCIKRKIFRSKYIINSTKYGRMILFIPRYWSILLERIYCKLYYIKQFVKLHV